MNELTAREQNFLESVKEWMTQDGNEEVYLCGSARGVLHIDEKRETLGTDDVRSLRPQVVDVLTKELGVIDARTDSITTLNLIHTIAKSGIHDALKHSANEDSYPEPNGSSPSM